MPTTAKYTYRPHPNENWVIIRRETERGVATFNIPLDAAVKLGDYAKHELSRREQLGLKR